MEGTACHDHDLDAPRGDTTERAHDLTRGETLLMGKRSIDIESQESNPRRRGERRHVHRLPAQNGHRPGNG